jgi:hypothetical protein
MREDTDLGTKLNVGIEASSGSLIQKWDDDDYYSDNFLSFGITHFPREKRENKVQGWGSCSIFLAGDEHLRLSEPNWCAGGTLLFERRLWRKCPFRPVASMVDFYFLQDHSYNVLRVNAPDLYMLVRHGRHTWKSLPDGTNTDEYLRKLPIYGRLEDVVTDCEDYKFYRSLAPI